jgi:hypothetical protein
MVRFTTTSGAVQPDAVMTDGGGLAQTTVRSSSPATVEVIAGSAKSAIEVTPIAPITPTPTPTPPVVPPNNGGPSQQPLAVAINVSPARAGDVTTFGLSVNGNSFGLARTDWTFGDGGALTTSTPNVSHVYAAAGSYTAGVTVTDTQGRSAAASLALIIDVPRTPDTTTPTTGLAITMGCTAANHGSPSPCNVAATYNGQAVLSNAIMFVDWDWGDGFNPTVAGPTATHIYAQAGSYRVSPRAIVNTVDGQKVATASQSITIQ